MPRWDIKHTVNFLYLKVEAHPKLLKSQSKFTLNYQQFEGTENEIKKKNKKCVQSTFVEIRGYFQVQVFELTKVV